MSDRTDSGIERTVTLPELPKLSGIAFEDILDIHDYLRRLNEAIATFHDQLAGRINEFLTFQEWQEATPDQITGDHNNYPLVEGMVQRLSSDAPRTVTGLLAPQVARLVICLNVGASNNISFLHQSLLSDAENRIITASGATLVLAAAQSVAFWYDLGTEAVPVNRWRQLTL
jgi:hypothetical protein